jgi:hypothetical protein
MVPIAIIRSLGRLLALPTNIRLGWKDFPGTDTLAYYEHLQITDVKSLKTFCPGSNCNNSKP